MPRVSAPNVPWRSIAAFITAVAVVGLAYLSFQLLSNREEAPEPQLAANLELVKPLRVYLTATDSKANKPLNLTLVARKDWRSTRLREEKRTLLHPNDHLITSVSFAGGGDGVEYNGRLDVENISAWLGNDDSGNVKSFRDLKTKQQKISYIDFLIALKRTRTVTTSDAETMPALEGETGNKESISYINSADGKLSGVIYIATIDGERTVVSEMAGFFDGQTVMSRYTMFATGSAKDEASQLAEQSTTMLKSLTLDTSQRNAQAPAINR